MTAAENYLKEKDVINSIHACYEQDLKIEINVDSINRFIGQLLNMRKQIAIAYIECSKFDQCKKDELIRLFSMYNEEIIKVVGLYTI
jgi:hypothetical protein